MNIIAQAAERISSALYLVQKNPTVPTVIVLKYPNSFLSAGFYPRAKAAKPSESRQGLHPAAVVQRPVVQPAATRRP